MKKLEPGMLCRVVSAGTGRIIPSLPRNTGQIVTLVRKIPAGDKYDGLLMPYDCWELDKDMSIIREPEGIPMRIPIMSESRLQPINPDHQPADEEWQADFKRLLSGDKQTARAQP